MEGHGYRSKERWKAWGMSCATWKMKSPTLGGCRSVAMGCSELCDEVIFYYSTYVLIVEFVSKGLHRCRIGKVESVERWESGAFRCKERRSHWKMRGSRLVVR